MQPADTTIDVDDLIEKMDLVAATFPRKALAARLTRRCQAMDKAIKRRELGTSNAKPGLIHALRILKHSQAEDACNKCPFCFISFDFKTNTSAVFFPPVNKPPILMPTVWIVVGPVDHPALFIPLVLAVELHRIAYG